MLSTLYSIILFIVIFFITVNNSYEQVSTNDVVKLGFKTDEGLDEIVEIPKNKFIFDITPYYKQDQITIQSIDIRLNPLMNNTYDNIRNNSTSTVVIYPAFTQAAYEKGGFYDYYKKKCDTQCLTLPIPDKIHGLFSSNEITTAVLVLLKYRFLTDIDVDKNPSILEKYDKVILLHNEYVTKTEYDAIVHHKNVVFLFPNALYSQITTNYDKNTFTLVRGHGYPEPHIKNGFDWKYDNSRYEYDVKCDDWNFYKKENYTMINCYPEFRILYSPELLRELTINDPTNILTDLSNWIRSSNINNSKELLNDFGINGKNIPYWVKKPATMTMNGDITRSQFNNILTFLSDQNILN